MATKKRTGLGRGIGALIPTSDRGASRPSDVFFDSETPAYPTTASSRTNPAESSPKADGASDDTSKAAPASEKSTANAPKRAAPARAPRAKVPAVDAAAAKSGAAKKATADKAPARRTTAAAASKARTAAKPDANEAVVAAETNEATTPAETTESTNIDSAGLAAGTTDTVPTAATAARGENQGSEDSTGDEDSDGLVEIPGATLRALDPNRIVPNAHQPRTEFDEDALQELITSVREFGVLQPIVVRPIPADHPLRDEADFELIMGERRLRATKAAGLESIPAVIRNTEDDVMLRDALLENLHRSQLNPLEEASAYQQLLNDFGITQEVLAERIGRSRPQISNTLRLLRLPLEVQRRVAAGVLSAGHARAILSAGEPAAMQQLADKIVNEDLSVRSAEAAAAKSSSAKADTQAPIHKEPRSGLTGYLDEIGEQLGDRLNTRVKVTLRRTKGQIVVDFASIADLNRILEELGESAPGK
jgi:ParB/RepB/Spo0J family partition protein